MTQKQAGRRAVAPRGEGTRLREEILDATIALVEELDDPWQLSLRAVARKVGITATSIYLHFESLEALLLAAKHRMWQQFGEDMVAAAEASDGTPYEKVLAFGRAYVTYANEHPGAFRTLFTKAWKLPVDDGMTFAGEAQFALLAQVLHSVSGSAEEAHLRAVQLWCGIHGLVVLRQPMSQFPWPDVDEQLVSLARAWTTPSPHR
ncbi:TetR/AcrR family transcriptional regulator [Flexivirga alba]|uniref:TetR/AcrR family transcriptional regulator n=1 Tax=Flexivirga alba TaxID=702742 RepID=A0ABW2ADR8_9MICO